MSGVTEVRVTRSRDVLEGQILPVTGRLRRHGRVELLVVLPDGTSRLIPQAWTDSGDGDGTGAAGATLGSVSDLLASCMLVAGARTQLIIMPHRHTYYPRSQNQAELWHPTGVAKEAFGPISHRTGLLAERPEDRG